MKNLKEIVEDLQYDYEYVGIRVQEVPFELGEIDHVSNVWDDGDDTGDELDGICALRIRPENTDEVIELSKRYFGDHVALLVSQSAAYGEDVGEIVMEDAEVAYIIA